MPSGQGAGTNPIHNKKPKKKAQDPDDMDPSELAHREKMKADEKKRKELAAKVGGKSGPLNSGGQGIKKSGKK